MVASIKALLGDFIRSRPSLCLHSPLSRDEEVWFESLHPGAFRGLSIKVPLLQNWEIRKDKEGFETWCKEQGRSLLFFDRAAKGNPGEAGGGGVLYDPEGNMNLTYSWNLGIDSNNMAEALALWQGLSQAIRLGIQDLMVVGDSRLIIHHLICRSFPSSTHLRQVI